MATNDFNLGRDNKVDIIDPQEGPLRFAITTSFEATPRFATPESNGMDGETRRGTIPTGWDLSFAFDRRDGRIDDYFARREAIWFNGGAQPDVTITETIKNSVTGEVSQYRYTGVTLQMGATRWGGNTPVPQQVTANARRRIKVT